jgi:hypothetical protein
MAYQVSDVSRIASAAAVLFMALLMLVRHILLPRLSESELRRFDLPLILLWGVFATYLVGNFMAVLP